MVGVEALAAVGAGDKRSVAKFVFFVTNFANFSIGGRYFEWTKLIKQNYNTGQG